jgi:hypothetical protein
MQESTMTSLSLLAFLYGSAFALPRMRAVRELVLHLLHSSNTRACDWHCCLVGVPPWCLVDIYWRLGATTCRQLSNKFSQKSVNTRLNGVTAQNTIVLSIRFMDSRVTDGSYEATCSYGPGFDSRQGQAISHSSTASRPALGPTQPPIQWVPRALFAGVKAAGVWSRPLISIYCRGQEWWSYISTPPYVLMAWCLVN